MSERKIITRELKRMIPTPIKTRTINKLLDMVGVKDYLIDVERENNNLIIYHKNGDTNIISVSKKVLCGKCIIITIQSCDSLSTCSTKVYCINFENENIEELSSIT